MAINRFRKVLLLLNIAQEGDFKLVLVEFYEIEKYKVFAKVVNNRLFVTKQNKRRILENNL